MYVINYLSNLEKTLIISQ